MPSRASAKAEMPSLARPSTSFRVTSCKWCAAATCRSSPCQCSVSIISTKLSVCRGVPLKELPWTTSDMIAAQNHVQTFLALLDVGPRRALQEDLERVRLTASYLKCPSSSYDEAIQKRVAHCSKAISDGILDLQHIHRHLESSHFPC